MRQAELVTLNMRELDRFKVIQSLADEGFCRTRLPSSTLRITVDIETLEASGASDALRIL